MAHQSKPQLPKHPAQLTPQEMKSGIDRLKKCLEAVQSFNPQSVTDQFNTPELDALEASIDEALVRTFGADTLDYERYKFAKDFNRGPYNSSYHVPPDEFQASIARSKARSIALLGQAIKSLDEQLEERSSNPPVNQAAPETTRLPSRKVFIVHGHDEGPRESVARFIEKLGFEAIILHTRPNKGRTIITKFREEAAGVGFAVVLMTPDDLGKAREDTDLRPRARQNVIFELGFFIGALRPEHVAALVKGDIDLPSDYDGVVYISMDKEDWRTKLATELEAAHYDVDWNKVMRS
jgi:predicted nucleotide-binding protein